MLSIFTCEIKGKNNIFEKKLLKICIFDIFFVTLQPIKSVVRFLRALYVCEATKQQTKLYNNSRV